MTDTWGESDIIEREVCYSLIANRTASRLAHMQFQKEKQADPSGGTK